MKVIIYSDLKNKKIPNLTKFIKSIEKDHFDQIDVKKISDNLFRAKLSESARLLFSFYLYDNQTYCLVLEYLPNHEYEKSRFLASADIDESKIPAITSSVDIQAPDIAYINQKQPHFYYLNKAISFDEHQQMVYDTPPPLVIVGSAGSGKTALLLEKMKQSVGNVLYVSHSPYLVQNAREQYYSDNYINELQESIDFLSFKEYLETITVPQGKEITRADFQQWYSRHGDKKLIPQKVFEEFKGVLTGPSVDKPWLDRESYFTLGIKQSLFDETQREQVYTLFEKYLRFLDEANFYDTNIISQQYLDKVTPKYDFVVVDEVQDLTNTQLMLILRSLIQPSDFLLCGDANQIVHPNFFSWSKLKSLFFTETSLNAQDQTLKILQANYRNSNLVTNVANRILKLKHARFGSVDRESNFLVETVGEKEGKIQLLQDNDNVRKVLNDSTARSTKFAVLVMHPDQKDQASKLFATPLVFSIEEAKGLEYESIVLFNFIKEETQAYQQISKGVTIADLDVESLAYARAKNKSDKSLETYKFYINALYVAVTRAIKNLYLVEADHQHPLLNLLDLSRFTGEINIEKQTSSLEEWQKEAQRLEMQGKTEQAQNIRRQILSETQVPWKPLVGTELDNLIEQALRGKQKKAQLLLLEYSLMHHADRFIKNLIIDGFKPAEQAVNNPDKALKTIYKNHFVLYDFKHTKGIEREITKYGVNHRTRFNLTPLMTATIAENLPQIEAISALGADRDLIANNGLNAWQMYLGKQLMANTIHEKDVAKCYGWLAPASTSIQIDGRLEKLDEHTMYNFLLNVFISLWYQYLPEKLFLTNAFTAAELCQMLAKFPDSVLPPMKKKQTYISRYLSANECNRDGAGTNKKLFFRIKRGHYILNPALKFKIDDQWLTLIERLDPDQWTINDSFITKRDNFHYRFPVSNFHRERVEQYRQLYRTLTTPNTEFYVA